VRACPEEGNSYSLTFTLRFRSRRQGPRYLSTHAYAPTIWRLRPPLAKLAPDCLPPASLAPGQRARWLLAVRDVKEEDVISFDRSHCSAGALLRTGANLSGLCVTALSRSLGLPERDSEGFPGLAVAEDDVADVTRLAAYAWMNDVAYNAFDIGDTIGRRPESSLSKPPQPPIRLGPPLD
jgi:hypothetical protein